MIGSNVEVPDAARARLRSIVAIIDREISRLPRLTTTEGHGTTEDALIVSWAELVRLLALGPAPELRECPVCKHIGMRTATRCGYCWTSLLPFTSAAGDEQGARPQPA